MIGGFMSAHLSPEAIKKAAQKLSERKQSPSQDIRRVKTGYVMMLDVLGFRETVSKRSGSDFFEIWSSIQKTLKKAKEERDNNSKYITSLDLLFLSDTLVLCESPKKGYEKIFKDKLILMGLPFLIDSIFLPFMLEHHVFFRGAISYGEYEYDKELQIIMGDAIDEVSEWYEKTDWVGLILTPSAEYAIESINNNPKTKIHKDLNRLFKRFRKYEQIPFKVGTPPVCHYAFYWFQDTDDINQLKTNLSTIQDLFAQIKHLPSFSVKYWNAFKFIRFCIEQDIEVITNKANNS